MPTPRLLYKDRTPLSAGDLIESTWSRPPHKQVEMLVRTERVTDLDHPLVEQGMTKFYVMDCATGKMRNFISSHDIVVGRKPS